MYKTPLRKMRKKRPKRASHSRHACPSDLDGSVAGQCSVGLTRARASWTWTTQYRTKRVDGYTTFSFSIIEVHVKYYRSTLCKCMYAGVKNQDGKCTLPLGGLLVLFAQALPFFIINKSNNVILIIIQVHNPTY